MPNNVMPFIGQVAGGRRKYLNIFENNYDTLDGTGARDYIHVVDLATAHIKALICQNTLDNFIKLNIGSGKVTIVLELVKYFEYAFGCEIIIKYSARRNGDIDSFWADPTKAMKLINWQPNFSLIKICEDTWYWQKSNPNGYNKI